MSKQMTPSKITGSDVLELRKKRGMNQSQFWSKIGVTQSGGSRYESGRKIPHPTKVLLVIAYGTQAEADKAIAAIRPPADKK